MKQIPMTWTVICKDADLFTQMTDHLRCWESRKSIILLKTNRLELTAEFGIITDSPNVLDALLEDISQYTQPYTETVNM